jgi:hypothetical protein
MVEILNRNTVLHTHTPMDGTTIKQGTQTRD